MWSGGGLGIRSKVVHGQPADRRGRMRRHQRIFQFDSWTEAWPRRPPLAGMDFVERLGPDASASVFAVLRDRADIARAAAVSCSWRTLVMVVHRSKIRCLRLCPEVASITRIEQEQPTNSASSSNNGINEGDVGSAAAAAWESYNIEQSGYMCLAHAPICPHTRSSCIDGYLGASNTDNFPGKSIQNTVVSSI